MIKSNAVTTSLNATIATPDNELKVITDGFEITIEINKQSITIPIEFVPALTDFFDDVLDYFLNDNGD